MQMGVLKAAFKNLLLRSLFFVPILSLKQAWFDAGHKKTTINRGF